MVKEPFDSRKLPGALYNGMFDVSTDMCDQMIADHWKFERMLFVSNGDFKH
jgi:hypothetical protein